MRNVALRTTDNPIKKNKVWSNDKVEEMKEKIRRKGYETFDYSDHKKDLVGTIYLKNKMDYGFHIYHIHEPSETNPLAGKNGILTEMFYDLRNKKYWIKRNGREVQFSVRNIDSMFPQGKSQRSELFSFLSTDRNDGLYESAFQHLGAIGMEKTSMYGRFFYRLVTEHPYFELLFKAGVTVSSNIKIVNPEGTNPMEVLGLNKTRWKMFSKFGIPIKSIQNLSGFAYSQDPKCDEKMINYLSYIKSLENEFGTDVMKDFFHTEKETIYEYPYGYSTTALKIARDYGLPDKRVIKYIYFECDVSQGMDYRTAYMNYRDYMRMVNEMEYKRFDKYPKFLKTMHDIVSRNYNIKLSEVQKEQWKKRYEENVKFTYSCKGYKIFPPKEPDDLITEGNVLSHCVGTYINKVSKGLSTILFLRSADDVDTPLVTIEVVGDAIVQARGKMNDNPKKQEVEAIKHFADKFKLKYGGF